VLPDLQWADNISDAVLRVVIGAIAAGVLVSLVKLNAVSLTIGDSKLSDAVAASWLYGLILSFVAGFSERLIPDLLERTAQSAASPSPATQLVGAAAVVTAGAPPATPPLPQPAAGGEAEHLRDIRNDIQAGRQVLGALKNLGVGSELIGHVDEL